MTSVPSSPLPKPIREIEPMFQETPQQEIWMIIGLGIVMLLLFLNACRRD
jgi:hypothetical protein